MDNQKDMKLGSVNVELSAQELIDIASAFTKLKVFGGRMNPMQMTFVDQTK